MWIQYRTTIFRMELSSHIPLQCWDFYNFYQIGFRINTYTLHTGIFILSFEIIVEFITVTMTFLNMLFSISFECF